MKYKTLILRYLPYIISTLFFITYSILSIIKHNHFLSGYDLAVSDQALWLMSRFQNPISTPHAYAYTSLFSDHVEIIYALLSPIYWINDNERILIVLQAFLITLSGIPLFKIAIRKKIKPFVAYAILISFELFFGIQNAIWADVHSLVFAASFLPWFIYYIEKKDVKKTFIFFLLLISCKEDIAMFTFLISSIYFYTTRWRPLLIVALTSMLYALFIFFIYFPNLTPNGYRFQNEKGLLSNVKVENLYNTPEKRDVIIYSLAWYGFTPLLSPLYLIPVTADIAHYSVLGSDYVTSAQSIFLHYRVTLASLLALATIYAVASYKKLNNSYFATYILIWAIILQYVLHLPLSYLSKSWFWTESPSIKSINKTIKALRRDASVVSQVNITPHINHRKDILTLWPEKKIFKSSSPCGIESCDWFRWSGNPKYLLVDISSAWDTRHLLTNNQEFVNGITNLEKEKIISLIKSDGTTRLYVINKKPN